VFQAPRVSEIQSAVFGGRHGRDQHAQASACRRAPSSQETRGGGVSRTEPSDLRCSVSSTRIRVLQK